MRTSKNRQILPRSTSLSNVLRPGLLLYQLRPVTITNVHLSRDVCEEEISKWRALS